MKRDEKEDMDRSKTDEEYIQQFQTSGPRGKRKAFEKLYKRHKQPLRNYLYRLTEDRETVDDIAQEAFLRALNGLDQFEGKSSFKTWLYQIATNRWKNMIKKKRPVSGIVEEEDRKTNMRPEENVEQNETIQQVRDAIQTLPDSQRAALILVRFENMSFKEAAKALDISLTALETRVYRAYRKLRKSCKDLEPES